MRYLIPLILLSISLFSCGATSSATENEPNLQQQKDPDDLSHQVIIRRTEYGVPHVNADNLEAAGFALGYLQMEDYGERVAELLLKARGEWAKFNDLSGSERSSAIDSDASSKLEYKRAVETWQDLEKDTRDFIQGFAKGVNRYIELHPDEFDDWVKPHYTAYDVHARNIVSPSSGSVRSFLSAFQRQKERDNELALMQSENEILQLEDQTIWARLAARAEEPHPDVGSNVWAFAPERTTSGNAILVRNPHLSWDAGYYEAQVKVPGKFNFYGDFRIGQAVGIIGGFNEKLGWSTTNNSPDLDEVYSFDADPNKPDHYILDGASVPLEKELVTVEYKFGEAIGTETREFWSTPYGPVILREDGKVYVIKSAGDGEFRTGEQFFKMMKAQNLDEWKEAMQMRARVSSNLTYADADGNIFYVWNASMPDRPHEAGGDTTAFHVTSSDEMWQDFTDWEMLPQLENPEGGYLRNENDTYHFTNLNEVLTPDMFPSFYPEPILRLRSQHSLELVHNDEKFSLEDIVELKHSERMLMADRVKDDLIRAVEQNNPEGEVAEALQLIKDWDNTVAKDSRGGVLFKTWWNRYSATADSERVQGSPESVGYSATPEKLFKEPWSYDNPISTPYGLADYDRAVESFIWAIDEAKDRYGHWNLPWGEVHRAVIGDLDLAVGGCTGLLGCYRVIWYTDHEEDDQKLQVRGGDGWVFAVEFGDIPRAYTILAYGQSNKEDSPHYNDQLQNFVNNRMTPVAFTDEDVEEQMIREYRPGVK
ncbi:penicillin acylase family protein [Rhodohalobacter halophilus]|uniref:penicillin acylase family protein n=1 Tax=Rhodohalobacter halophilus TaxID=1812810 RepID=UPI00083FD4E8|nr:penicillin acylase family protein [Rhodohalobacter halophilus]